MCIRDSYISIYLFGVSERFPPQQQASSLTSPLKTSLCPEKQFITQRLNLNTRDLPTKNFMITNTNKTVEVDKDDLLDSGWCFWEALSLDRSDPRGSYKDSIKKLVDFDTLPTFAKVWNNFFYRDLSKVFYTSDRREYKKVKIQDKVEALDAVCLFRSGVHPSWEDALNAKGGEFRINFSEMNADEIDQLWENLVILIIGETLKHGSKILGIRFGDKTSATGKNAKPLARLEIWVDFRQEDGNLKIELEGELQKFFDQQSNNLVSGKVDYMYTFRNHQKNHSLIHTEKRGLQQEKGPQSLLIFKKKKK
eukprot:TRINITY_DN2017_c0_g2_i2.p1 TRINITY_DN2017_c0_g2~~TRINITY_DN2017_c0_g2_i2.p1  ORF type:complete len:318 (+),score=65.23 TRINITY_DN2017_c0_g2_i2:33-956(+)